jgi:hypothetical protein
MLSRQIVIWQFLLLIVTPLFGREVWVIRGSVTLRTEPCVELPLTWRADAVLHNFTDQPHVVQLLDTSHGPFVGSGEVVVDSNRSRSMALSPTGDGQTLDPIWITHMEVPDGIRVEGRLEFDFENCSDHPRGVFAVGAVSTPVFESLVPPNTPQVHFGTDLGIQPARYNVGVYNAGIVDALAHIEVTRPACPDDPRIIVQVTIPAGRFVQTSVFGIGRGTQCEVPVFLEKPVGAWLTYTTVTVDQPSLSYIVSLAGRPQVNVRFGAQ